MLYRCVGQRRVAPIDLDGWGGGRGRGDDGFMMISFRAPVDFLAVDEVS